jgi:hypothetical protein
VFPLFDVGGEEFLECGRRPTQPARQIAAVGEELTSRDGLFHREVKGTVILDPSIRSTDPGCTQQFNSLQSAFTSPNN